VRLQRERPIERQHGAVAVAQAVRREAQLVPRQRQIGIVRQGPFEGRQGIAEPAQVDERAAAQGLGECSLAELRGRRLGQPQRVVQTAGAAQQIEVLGPAGLELRVVSQHVAIRRFRVRRASFPRQVARPHHRALAGLVGEEIVRRGGPHAAKIYRRPASRPVDVTGQALATLLHLPAYGHRTPAARAH
jgi:hypothetical protein